MTLSHRIKSWPADLLRPVDASSLGLFRILFGLLLLWQVFYIFNEDFVEKNFVLAYYHFPFSLFDWLHLKRLPPVFMHGLFSLMGAAALGMMAGLVFRFFTAVFFLTFFYVFLFEKSLYNDHYYLILLISGLFFFMNADRWPALNNLRLKKTPVTTVPFWQIFVLRAQFIIIYFYSLVSKISSDWLIHAQPMQRILEKKGLPLDEPVLTVLAYVFSYGAIAVDFLILVLLLSGRRRPAAFLGIVFFNLINHWLFRDIGIFPFLMIVGFVVFLEPDAPRKVMNQFRRRPDSPENNPRPALNTQYKGRAVTAFVVVYILIQMAVPLRHWMYPGNPGWSFEGCRFSWRLKINSKIVKLKMTAVDPSDGKSTDLDYARFLTPSQQWMDNMPDMLYQYARFLREDLEKFGIMKNPRIYAAATASWNGRPFQPYIDGSVDLAAARYPLFSHARWIISLYSTGL